MSDSLRQSLLARVAQPSDRQLIRLAASIEALECGDLSPLCGAGRSGDKSPHSKYWPHAPRHCLAAEGTYLVTAGTLHKQHYFVSVVESPSRRIVILSAAKNLVESRPFAALRVTGGGFRNDDY